MVSTVPFNKQGWAKSENVFNPTTGVNARRCSKYLGFVKARIIGLSKHNTLILVGMFSQREVCGVTEDSKSSWHWRLLLVANKQRAGHKVQERKGPQDFSCFLPRIWTFSDNLLSPCLLHPGFLSACYLSWNTSVTRLRHMWQKWKDPLQKTNKLHKLGVSFMIHDLYHAPQVL